MVQAEFGSLALFASRSDPHRLYSWNGAVDLSVRRNALQQWRQRALLFPLDVLIQAQVKHLCPHPILGRDLYIDRITLGHVLALNLEGFDGSLDRVGQVRVPLSATRERGKFSTACCGPRGREANLGPPQATVRIRPNSAFVGPNTVEAGEVHTGAFSIRTVSQVTKPRSAALAA